MPRGIVNKQEEIREEVWQILRRHGLHVLDSDGALDDIMECLHSRGVRIIAERKLPRNPAFSASFIENYERAQQDMLKWHNESLEPLIKEEIHE